MKHLFTLSERLKGRGRGSAISATSASAIFCKLVGMVKLFMPFMKATKRQSDTTFFAESLKSLKSLMSIFAESAESAKSAKPIFANRGVKDVRVSLDQYSTNIQRISNLYITPNRYLTRFAAVFAFVFVLGVGNVWGATYTKITSVSGLPSDGESAKYLIVYETLSYIYDGSKTGNNLGASGDYKSSGFTKSGTSITPTTDNFYFTISRSGSNYTIKSASGYYIGRTTNSNGINQSTSESYSHTITFDNSGNAQITSSGGPKLQFLNSSGSYTFKYYSSSQKLVQLYKEEASTPTITTSVSSLSEVGYSTADFSQQMKSFTVSGSNLTTNVTVTAPTNYEVCKTSGGTYTSSVTFDKGSGTLSAQTVYVRLASGKAAGNYSGNVACTSDGATTKNVAVSGSVPFTVTWKANGTTHATTYVAYATGAGTALGSLPTDPDPEDYCGDAFYGWYDGNSYKNVSVAPDVISTSTKITSDKIYNAVFADEIDGGSITKYKLVSSLTNGKDYIFVTRNTAGSGYALSSSFSNSQNTGTSVSVETSGDDVFVSGAPANSMIWTAATGWYLTTKDDTKTNKVLKINGTTFALDATGSTNLTWTTNYGLNGQSGNGKTKYYVQCSNGTFTKSSTSGSTTNRVWAYEKTTVSAKTYTNFTTTCCQPLAQVNGSVNWSQGEAELHRDKIDGVNSWAVAYKLHSEENYTSHSTAWTDEANNRCYTTTKISGLEAGKVYDFKITATPDGEHCAGDVVELIESVTVPQITTSAATITNLNYAEGSGPSAAQSFIVSGSHLTGNLTVTAPANFKVCATENGEYTTLVELTPTEEALSNVAVYVKMNAGLSQAAQAYTGNITISGGGAASKSVALSGIVSSACEAPTINTQPASATYDLNADATALSVEATKNGTGPALTYQWYSNTENSNSNGTLINGATSSTYIPSTSAAGTNYYYCEINSGACSASSECAEIVVNQPAITLNKSSIAFGEKEIGGSYQETFTVSGAYMIANIGIAKTGDSEFTIDKTSVVGTGTIAATVITVTYAPTAAGSHSGTLTLTSTGAEEKTVTLSGTGINLYTVTLNAGTGSVSADGWAENEGVWTKKQASNAEALTLPDATLTDGLVAAGWSFAGWKTESAVTIQTDVKPGFVEASYTPASDITLYAVYSISAGGSSDYELVEEDLGTAWAGDYLIAYSDDIFADGRIGGKDDTGAIGKASVSVNPSTNLNGKVVAASWGDTYNVSLEEISENSNTYVLKTKDGKYNYRNTNSNGLDVTNNKSTAAEYPITVTFNSSSNIALASSAGPIFKYNQGTTNQPATFFRFYASGQQPIYLYKKGTPEVSYFSNPSNTVTLTYDANGATAGSAPDAVDYSVGDEATVVAKPEGLAKTGYTFAGWNTKADGTGTNYVNGSAQESFTINTNTTLYAKWTINTHKVSVSSVDHGIITATPEGASAIAEDGNNAAVAYGTVVSLAQTNDTHFTFDGWTVTKDGDAETVVEVTNNAFTMPDYDVVISATFTENAKRNVVFYSNGTQVGEKVTTYVGEAPATAPTAVYDDCLEGSNQFYGWATEEWTGAIASTAGKTVYRTLAEIPAVVAGEGDVNYYAVWAKATTTFQKGTSADLKNGQKVVIVHNNSSKALENDGTSWEGADVTINTNQISDPASTIQWTIETTTNGFYLKNGSNQYLKGQNKSGGPYILLTNTTNKWTLTNDGTYVLKDENNRYLEYYSNAFTTFGSYNSNNANCYVMDFYVPVMDDFRTNCCGLKPVTNVQVGTIGETSIELTWTAPTSKTGITKYQIVDAEHSIAQDVTNVDAIKATVTGLTECTTYNFKVVSVGSECSSNSNVVEATPFAGAKVVTFDYNGGSGATTSASTSCGVETVNLPTPDARDGYNFKGWNDGTQTLAPSTATYTPDDDITLVAQWAQLFTVHYEFAGASGAPDDAQYEAGATVELPSEPSKGFLAPFKAWSFSPSIEVSEGKFAMPAEDVTITATYDEIVGQWMLVTDESSLNVGDYVIIAAAYVGENGASEAMKTTQNSTNYRYTTSITKSGSIIENPSNDVQIFVLEAGTVANSWAFKCLNGEHKDKYIYANSNGSNNYMNSQATNDANGSWKLNLVGGYATAQGTNKKKVLQYNSDRFACYETASQSAIAFYQFREGTFYAVNMPSPAPTGGSVTTNKSMAKAGETVTLTYAPSRGYTVKTLTVTGATSGEITISPAVEAGVTEYTFTMPAEAVTVAASFEAVPPVEYSLVENASDIAMGMQFVMLGTKADGTEPYVIGEMNNSNRLAGDAVEASAIDAVNKTLSLTTEAAVDFTMDGETGAFKIKYNNQYLEAGSNNTVRWSNTGDAWTIAISNGKATITSGDYKLNYNPSQHWVAAYTTAQQPVALYALPYTTYNFELSGCKTIKVATGYTYTYTIKSTDVPADVPAGYAFLNKWTDGTNVYGVGDEVVVSAAKTLEPCWKVTPTADVDINDLPASVTEIVVKNGKTLTVDAPSTLDNLTVEAGGKVDGSGNLTVNDFTIEGQDGKSGQVMNADKLTINGDAYFDFTLAVSGTTAANQWHNFSVPFPVSVMDGVYNAETGAKLTNEVDYAIEDYHGDLRAQGKYGWKKYRGIMQPGITYSMTVNGDIQTFRFKKVAGAYSFDANPSVGFSQYNSGENTNAGWNGLGNMRLCYASVNNENIKENNGVRYVQILDAAEYAYKSYAVGDINLTVGSAFFIQAANNGTMTFAAAHNAPDIVYAPARTEAKRTDKPIAVTLSNENQSDRMYITASEDAKSEYQIGCDLQKMFATNTPQAPMIYSVNYGGIKLAAEEAPIVNDKASYALILYAPANGTYRIETPTESDNADLYLTKDGHVIWNLSMNGYEVELTKGTTEGYGLLLVRKAPSVATGVEEPTSDSSLKGRATKVVVDEHVYILRDGQMYDVTGKAVK